MCEIDLNPKTVATEAGHLVRDSLRQIARAGYDFGEGLIQGGSMPFMVPTYLRQRSEAPDEDYDSAFSCGKLAGTALGFAGMIFCMPELLQDPSDMTKAVYGIAAITNAADLFYEGSRAVRDYLQREMAFFPKDSNISRTNRPSDLEGRL